MKAEDIKKLSLDDLKVQLAETKANYTKTKLAHKISPVENPIQIRELRRTVARLLTELANRK